MARAAVTLDVFSAVAEPKRRRMLDVLGDRPMAVNDIVGLLRWPQPQVSKHLGVLREVGLVNVTRRGRQQIYKMSAEQLKPIHDWVKTYERFWTDQLHRIKASAEAKVRHRENPNQRSDHHG
jgi:DNA-binding transcriptional ArsR family regulator